MGKALVTTSRNLEIIAAEVDVSRNHVLKLMSEFAIDEQKMIEVLECVLEYRAKPRRVLQLARDHSLPIHQVSAIYEVREAFGTSGNYSVALEQVALLRTPFPDFLDLESPEGVRELIAQINEFYNKRTPSRHGLYAGTCISWFMEARMAHVNDEGYTNPWLLLEFLRSVLKKETEEEEV